MTSEQDSRCRGYAALPMLALCPVAIIRILPVTLPLYMLYIVFYFFFTLNFLPRGISGVKTRRGGGEGTLWLITDALTGD